MKTKPKNVKQRLGSAIRKLRQGREARLIDVASATGIDTGNLSRMELGKQEITQEKLEAIANYFGMTPAEIYASAALSGVDDVSQSPELQPGPDVVLKRVPLVGNTQGGPDRHWEELGYPAGFGEAYVDVPSKDPNAYALRVVGASMAPRMMEGEVVLCSPREEAHPGDEVVVRTKEGEVMVKRLVYIRDGEVALDSVADGHGRIVRELEDIEFMHLVVAIVRASAVKKR